MPWFRPIRDNVLNPPLMTSESDLKGFDETDFRKGSVVSGWDETAWLRAGDPSHDGRPNDALLDHLGIPVFSARLRAKLDQSGVTNVQYLSVNVFQSDWTPVPGYAIANVLKLVQAVDQKLSDYELFGEDWPGREQEIHFFRKLVIRSAAADNLHIFRLKEYPLYTCVSGLFRDAFEERGFSGYSFHPVEAS